MAGEACIQDMVDSHPGWRLAAHFFESLPDWLAAWQSIALHCTPQTAEAAAFLAHLAHADQADLEPAYQALCMGTDASLQAPLWASACVGNEPILADATTLRVIELYRTHGFQSTPHRGHPPDYIATLFRFLDSNPPPEAVHTCLNHYIGPILHAIADATAGYPLPPVIGTWLAILHGMVRTGHFPFDAPPVTGRPSRGRPMPLDKPRTIRTAGYNNCGGRCVITLDVQEDCVLSMGTDAGGTVPPLRACLRGREYRHTFFHAGRLRQPMRRVGKRGEGRFRAIGWDEAMDLLAGEWTRIRDTYGPASRFIVYGTGVVATMRPSRMAQRLLNLDGGFLDTYNSYSDACAAWGTRYTYGDARSGNEVDDTVNSRLILLWGHNPLETVFGSERLYYLQEAKRRGARIIVIDPRCSDTARALADEWIGIVPSTDSALADAMAHVIWSEGLADRAFLDTFCLGHDAAHMPPGAPADGDYVSYLMGRRDGVAKTPAWAETITGVPAAAIVQLARDYATTKPACLLPGYGPQRTGNGEQTTRSLCLLACLTGNVGIPGGGAGGAGWINRHAESPFPTGRNPYPGRIPNFLWSKAVDDHQAITTADGLTGVPCLESPIKLLFCLGSNTLVNQHSNINETIRILADESKCECIVCSDLFMTPSARYADLLLPAASGFETDNMTGPWSYGNYLLYNNQVRPPLFQSRFEWDWFCDLAERLGLKEPFVDGKPTVEDWLRFIYGQVQSLEPELPPFDEFRRNGGHRYRNRKAFIAYQKQREDFAANPFPAPSGKIELYSPRLQAMNVPMIPAIPCYTPCPEGPEDPFRQRFPLQLIGWHTKRRTHSIHDQNPRLEAVEPPRLWMHPQDAAARGIADGTPVRIYNDRGEVHMPVLVTDRIIRGVVAMPQGAWYTPDAHGVDTRGSINTLTATRPTPLAKANPQHTNLVQVAPLPQQE